MYEVLKLIHIFLAIVAVGFNISYGIWIARAARKPQHQLHVLKGIKVLDDRFANPAYALLLVTGLAMVWVGDIPLTTFWIAGALVLYAVVVILGLGFYTPALRRQIRALEAEGPASAAFRTASRRAQIVGPMVAVPVLVILFLMVMKPTL